MEDHRGKESARKGMNNRLLTLLLRLEFPFPVPERVFRILSNRIVEQAAKSQTELLVRLRIAGLPENPSPMSALSFYGDKLACYLMPRCELSMPGSAVLFVFMLD